MKTEILLPHLRLKLNLQHLNYESCYCDGYLAALEEQEIEKSPFKEDTQEYQYWIEGWWAAFYGEEPLFDLDSERYQESIVGENSVTTVETSGIRSANDDSFSGRAVGRFMKVAGAIAATALIGYQVLDLIA